MSKPIREELLKQREETLKRIPPELRADDYPAMVAKQLGIELIEVTEEDREKLRKLLSKGEPLSKIIIATRYGDDE